MAFTPPTEFFHVHLPCGVEFAADQLPARRVVAITFRLLAGVAEEPRELSGIGMVVERTLSKGTQVRDGQALADAFDLLGAQWGTASGRQSMILRVLCLPEFALDTIDLVAEMLSQATLPDEACRVAVQLASEQRKHLEDDPHELLRLHVQRNALGPVYGRHVGGEPETLARITPEAARRHWADLYQTGRLQVAVAGPIEARLLAERIQARFSLMRQGPREGRGPAVFEIPARRAHCEKQLQQQYISISLPGLPKDHPEFAVEQVLIGVLSGGMSGRLFTEVREKLGLVYWVAAWHEQPRGKGLIHLGASTTPERCHQTYETLLRELRRISEDLAEEETRRARDALIAQALTEDDLTRARAGSLSDDLFHFSRPIGLEPKLEAVRAVTVEQVRAYAKRLPLDGACVVTLGPRQL